MFSIFGKKETAEKKQQRQQREIQQLEQQKNILDYKIKDINELSKKSLRPVGKRGNGVDEFIMIPVNNQIILPGNVKIHTNNPELYCSSPT